MKSLYSLFKVGIALWAIYLTNTLELPNQVKHLIELIALETTIWLCWYYFKTDPYTPIE
jgi:hypothetical protein